MNRHNSQTPALRDVSASTRMLPYLHWGLAFATIVIALSPAGSLAGAPADTTLAARQKSILREVALDGAPFRTYNFASGGCGQLNVDSYSLVAVLEAKRRNIDLGIDSTKYNPSTFPQWAQHMASEAIRTRTGTELCPGSPGRDLAMAALAYAFHQHGSSWSNSIRSTFQTLGNFQISANGYQLVNGNPDKGVAAMLIGEALQDSAMYQRGEDYLRVMAEDTYAHGFREAQAPLYTAEHFPPLVFAQKLNHTKGRALCRILLETELLVTAHQYLPGGALLPPHSRNYAGGASTTGGLGTLNMSVWAFTGDAAFAPNLSGARVFMLAGALDYRLPTAIRDIFLDKAEGYDFWTRSTVNSSGVPNAVYKFGELYNGHQQVSPWSGYVLPGGEGALGFEYGWGAQGIEVTSGVFLRTPNGFAITYHYQPEVTNDTNDKGDPLRSAGLDSDPDDFTSELYDYERMRLGRTLVSLWDPRPRSGMVRQHPDTRARIPDFKALGGEQVRRGKWIVGRVGKTLIGYYPLSGSDGAPIEEARSGYTYFRLPGRSGYVIEMVTTQEFATIGAYADDLATRNVAFTTDPLTVEVNAYEPGKSTRRRMRLEYRPELRYIDGIKQELSTIDHGLMESPWVKTDKSTHRVTLRRECRPVLVYDFANATVQELAPRSPCEDLTLTSPKAPIEFQVK